MDNFIDNFSVALAMLKDGKKMARKEWKENMYIYYKPGHENSGGDDVAANLSPSISMQDSRGYIIPGWTPSCPDLFADDWGAI